MTKQCGQLKLSSWCHGIKALTHHTITVGIKSQQESEGHAKNLHNYAAVQEK